MVGQVENITDRVNSIVINSPTTGYRGVLYQKGNTFSAKLKSGDTIYGHLGDILLDNSNIKKKAELIVNGIDGKKIVLSGSYHKGNGQVGSFVIPPGWRNVLYLGDVVLIQWPNYYPEIEESHPVKGMLITQKKFENNGIWDMIQ